MPKIQYQEFKFSKATLDTITRANTIIAEYLAQGFSLTLRQLYYQFVARGLLANKDTEYKRLGSIINDARLAGLVDWTAIEDRTRFLRSISAWSSPKSIVAAVADQYKEDLWRTQPYRPEVWIEKDALVGVIEDVCEDLRVPYFSCRGYTSQSEMWAAAQRMLGHQRKGQTPFVLHLGDHDPSGIDMSRDIQDRINLFTHGELEFNRLALNSDQVDTYNPPPNPAKVTDSRARGYIAQFGHESWELDALEPAVIANLIRGAIENLRDDEAWTEVEEAEDRAKSDLELVSGQWGEVVDFVRENA